MGYTRDEIIKKCEKEMKKVSSFYKQDMINYLGKTKDTNEYYTEVIAEFVCTHIGEFEKIPVITREKSYCVKTHTGKYSESSNRIEEITAMKMFLQTKEEELDYLGKIIDYQTPLNNIKDDGAGKIDLLSVKDNIVYILELKKEDSDETLLRCVLEGYTYLKTVNTEKLLSDFKLPADMKVKASPLVFKNGVQYKEMLEGRTWISKLMEMLDSKPYYFSTKDDKYIITED